MVLAANACDRSQPAYNIHEVVLSVINGDHMPGPRTAYQRLEPASAGVFPDPSAILCYAKSHTPSAPFRSMHLRITNSDLHGPGGCSGKLSKVAISTLRCSGRVKYLLLDIGEPNILTLIVGV
jgi:hypothetical protein